MGGGLAVGCVLTTSTIQGKLWLSLFGGELFGVHGAEETLRGGGDDLVFGEVKCISTFVALDVFSV